MGESRSQVKDISWSLFQRDINFKDDSCLWITSSRLPLVLLLINLWDWSAILPSAAHPEGVSQPWPGAGNCCCLSTHETGSSQFHGSEMFLSLVFPPHLCVFLNSRDKLWLISDGWCVPLSPCELVWNDRSLGLMCGRSHENQNVYCNFCQIIIRNIRT